MISIVVGLSRINDGRVTARARVRFVVGVSVLAAIVGLSCRSYAEALAIGGLVGLAGVDAIGGIVPFIVGLPVLVVALTASMIEGRAYETAVGLAIVASAVGLVLLGIQQRRLLGFGILAYVVALVGAAERWPAAIAAGVAAWFFLLVALHRAAGEKQLSGGDVVLAALVGAALGWRAGSAALLAGVVIAITLWAIFVRGRARTLRFGPSLALGTVPVLWVLAIHPVG